MFKVDVVENRAGKPAIRWGAAIFATVVMAFFTTFGAVGAYYLLTGTFSPLAAIVGFSAAVTAVVSGISRQLKSAGPGDQDS